MANTLGEIGNFIDCKFDYELIHRMSIGTLRQSNSTFCRPDGTPASSPVRRWRTHCSESDVVQVESAIGSLLEELGYPLEYPAARTRTLSVKLMQEIYPTLFDCKEWVKTQTPAGRFVNTDRLRFNDLVDQ
jgi:hypothetical protein